MQLVCEMKGEGLFDGDHLNKSPVQLCFQNIIQVRLSLWLMWTALPSLEQMNDDFKESTHSYLCKAQYF